MEIKEVNLTDEVLEQLIALSEAWEAENSCRGYRKNRRESIEGKRIFLAIQDDETIGYLFGHTDIVEKASSVYQAGTKCFEIEELYVKPAYRCRGVGKELFRYAESVASDECDALSLSTATKDFRAILHFYIEELGMEFWYAQLFKVFPRKEIN